MEDIKYRVILAENMEYFVEQNVINEIPTFVQMFNNKNDTTDKYTFQLNNIDGNIFSQIITFIRYKIVDSNDTTFLNKQIDTMNVPMLLDIILAAKYLGIVDVVNKAVDRFKYLVNNQTPEQMRTLLNINSDFSEEDETKNTINLIWQEETIDK